VIERVLNFLVLHPKLTEAVATDTRREQVVAGAQEATRAATAPVVLGEGGHTKERFEGVMEYRENSDALSRLATSL
jgi:hypothetical protein